MNINQKIKTHTYVAHKYKKILTRLSGREGIGIDWFYPIRYNSNMDSHQTIGEKFSRRFEKVSRPMNNTKWEAIISLFSNTFRIIAIIKLSEFIQTLSLLLLLLLLVLLSLSTFFPHGPASGSHFLNDLNSFVIKPFYPKQETELSLNKKYTIK